MGFLDTLFRRKGSTGPAESPVEDVPCPHGSLVPRWDQPEEMGKRELVSTYLCESCGRRFSREEGERIMAEAGETLRVSEEERL